MESGTVLAQRKREGLKTVHKTSQINTTQHYFRGVNHTKRVVVKVILNIPIPTVLQCSNLLCKDTRQNLKQSYNCFVSVLHCSRSIAISIVLLPLRCLINDKCFPVRRKRVSFLDFFFPVKLLNLGHFPARTNSGLTHVFAEEVCVEGESILVRKVAPTSLRSDRLKPRRCHGSGGLYPQTHSSLRADISTTNFSPRPPTAPQRDHRNTSNPRRVYYLSETRFAARSAWISSARFSECPGR